MRHAHYSLTRSMLTWVAFILGISLWTHGCSDEAPVPPATVGTTSSSTGVGAGGNSGGSSGVGGEGAAGAGNSGGSGGQAVGPDCSLASGTQAQLKLTEIASGLQKPVLLTAPAGDDERLFIVEQPGRIQLLKNGTSSLFLDITSLVNFPSAPYTERGLLGLAFHPDYAQNGRFFVHYTDNSGDTAVAEYARSADPDVATAEAVAVLLTADQPAGNHNGGSIEFSPDSDILYIGLGDGGGADDQFDNGQDTDTLLGAMLRIDVAEDPYEIPTGNLEGGNNCGSGVPATAGPCSEIWTYGLRNPYRFSFDACTSDLYIGDVGQNQWEEIDVVAPGETEINFGWPLMEGTHCFTPSSNCDPGNLTTLPAVEYNHGGGKCSVSGGYVYRGSAIPWLRGAYLYGDFCTSQIWMFRWAAGNVTDEQELTTDLESQALVGGQALSSFGQDSRGEMYVLSLEGRVYRIDPE